MKYCLPVIALSILLLQACRSTAPISLDYEEIIESYVDDGHIVDCRKISLLNLALAETGQLADKLFHYTQAGSDCILIPWDLAPETAERLSDVYWSMGHIALAQRMAFEANVLDDDSYNPRMLCRLIETNLAFGYYPVARKYIDLLGKKPADRAIADRYRPFLNNDSLVEADPVLGPKRRCIPEKDFISMVRGIEEDLKDIIRANPSNRKAVEYLGSIYLLDCKMDDFKAMLDEFYGTEALKTLPASFAEAACMLSELNRGYWKEVGVSPETNYLYWDFKKRLGTGLSMDKFKNTFWYYIMRANNQ